MKRVIFYIPARRGSSRLPDKNIKRICNKTLIAHSVEFANTLRQSLSESGAYVEIWLDTNYTRSEANVNENVEYNHYMRPSKLCDDDVSMFDVFENFYTVMKYKPNDIFVMLQPTSPLRNEKTILGYIWVMLKGSVSSVGCRSTTRIKNQVMLVNFDTDTITQYGKNEAVTENGNFFIFTMPCIADGGCISGNQFLAPVPSNSPFNDVDTEIDFAVVKMFMETPKFLDDFYAESLI